MYLYETLANTWMEINDTKFTHIHCALDVMSNNLDVTLLLHPDKDTLFSSSKYIYW